MNPRSTAACVLIDWDQYDEIIAIIDIELHNVVGERKLRTLVEACITLVSLQHFFTQEDA